MSDNERSEKHFTRYMDKTATIHLPTPAYHWNTVPPRTVNPAEQRPWYENPVLCARRDLNQMTVHAVMNINGHIVERHAMTARPLAGAPASAGDGGERGLTRMKLLPPFVGVPEVNKVYQVNALMALKAMADNSVDLVFADPPYNLGYGYDVHNDKMPESEYLAWCYEWITELIRVLKPTGSLFILHLPKFAIPIGAFLHSRMEFQHWIAWKAASRSSNKPLMPEHYALLYYTKSKEYTANEVRYPHKRCRKCNELIADYGGKAHLAHAFGPQISDVWTDIGRAKHGQRGEHPCKLPDKLVGRVIEFASNPGDLVLDPFNGTGTTTYMAQQLNRQYIGIDLSPVYVEIARDRLAQPYTPPLFATA